ncbi:response regulator transcription factor [Burkholderia territorii]|uniref:response regulator transcription factor n=1 Tax=Burkholderia territorii TaxID=1503055 RepID=UPI00075BB350|nr:response regulator transcription factor [Burkholderia territorii]KWE32920.1 LuxR family transcriptional regulator [Burkholderia territorii]KWE46922.1 LuxR family transcriptional regulator [Burkholderia territorii]KWE47169.1 LuxR family transcriptional regulator [Burkholderia territorii]
MNESSIRVAIADDHPMLLSGVAHELENASGLSLVGSARNSTELINLLESSPCDVVVSDYMMPGGDYSDGITLFSFIRRRYPGIRVVVLTMMENAGIVRSLIAHDVTCILSKSDAISNLVIAVYVAQSGGEYYSPKIEQVVREMRMDRDTGMVVELSPREVEVVRLYATGMRVDDIAANLHRTKQTVSTQKTSAMRKLGIKHDAELVKYAIEVGLVSFADPELTPIQPTSR